MSFLYSLRVIVTLSRCHLATYFLNRQVFVCLFSFIVYSYYLRREEVGIYISVKYIGPENGQ